VAVTESSAVRIAGLTRRYGSRVAVDALDLEVPRGVIFGFLGPNGAGKTTTIRMLLGLSRADAGEAWILGHHFQRERAAICPRVGAIVETPTFHTELTGIDNLRVVAWTSGVSPGRTALKAVLERVGLQGRGEEPVKGYSLGMRQRLGLAAALVHRPEMLFLDEPTNGLDPAGTIEVRRLLTELAEGGTTIFLSSHILHEVEAVCSELAILHQGRLRLRGELTELLRQEDCFRLRVSPRDRAQALLVEQGLTLRLAGEDSLDVEVAEADVPALVRSLCGAGVDVYRITEVGGTLEDLFMQWTREAEAP